MEKINNITRRNNVPIYSFFLSNCMHLDLNKVGPNELVKLNFSYFLYRFRIDIHLIQKKYNAFTQGSIQ